MPTYNYKCKKCGHHFSKRRRIAERRQPLVCTSCNRPLNVDDKECEMVIDAPMFAELQMNQNIHARHNPNSPMVKRTVEYTDKNGKVHTFNNVDPKKGYGEIGSKK